MWMSELFHGSPNHLIYAKRSTLDRSFHYFKDVTVPLSKVGALGCCEKVYSIDDRNNAYTNHIQLKIVTTFIVTSEKCLYPTYADLGFGCTIQAMYWSSDTN